MASHLPASTSEASEASKASEASAASARGTSASAVPSAELPGAAWRFARFSQAELSLTIYMGVSENSVPLNPMVNDHYPY